LKPNYSLGNMATTLAGKRYLGELQRIAKSVEETGGADFNSVLATTYLRGLYDMACLHIGVTNGDDLSTHLKQIDARVMSYENGGYEDEPDDGAEVEPDA